LIQTEDGKNILVDTGFPEKLMRYPPVPEPASMDIRSGEYLLIMMPKGGKDPVN
jgi:hypothetical protein